ncbi:MAG: ribonuclease HI [Bacteroidota bacterium]
MKKTPIMIYTDGSSRGNPGRGGYAAILQYGGHEKVLVEGFTHTTNNRMELLAVIVGLEALKSAGQKVRVFSDSRYVVDAVEKRWLEGWIKKGFKQKKNKDLWLRFWTVYQKHKVHFSWVEGHAGHPMNERCDRLATDRAKQGPWHTDTGYLAGHLPALFDAQHTNGVGGSFGK